MRIHLPGAMALVAALLSTGCYTSTKEVIYLAAVDLDDKPNELEFYRVTVESKAVSSRTRYQTGFYDADILHDLYGDVPNPEFAKKEDEANSDTTVKHEAQFAVDPSGREVSKAQDRRFTILFGTNADAIAQQIKLFSENQEMGQAFGQLLAASTANPEYVTTQKARNELDAVKGQGKLVAASLEKAATELEKTGVDQAKADAALFAAARETAKALGKELTFDPAKRDEAIAAITAFRDGLSK